MDIQQILRWLITAIVLVVAIMLLNAILDIAGFLLGAALRVLLVLLLLAVALRFIEVLQQRRR